MLGIIPLSDKSRTKREMGKIALKPIASSLRIKYSPRIRHNQSFLLNRSMIRVRTLQLLKEVRQELWKIQESKWSQMIIEFRKTISNSNK